MGSSSYFSVKRKYLKFTTSGELSKLLCSLCSSGGFFFLFSSVMLLGLKGMTRLVTRPGGRERTPPVSWMDWR